MVVLACIAPPAFLAAVDGIGTQLANHYLPVPVDGPSTKRKGALDVELRMLQDPPVPIHPVHSDLISTSEAGWAGRCGLCLFVLKGQGGEGAAMLAHLWSVFHFTYVKKTEMTTAEKGSLA